MVVQDHVERIQLAVTNTGNTDLFIGLEWLWRHNSSIDWKKSQILFNRCPAECGFISSLDDLEWEQVRDVPQQAFHLSDGEWVFTYNVDSWVANRVADHGYSEEPAEVTEDVIFRKWVPEEYHKFSDIFAKKDFEKLPECRSWDHAIELTPGFELVDCKVYLRNPQEHIALDEFLEENLCTRRIRPSKSPMALPFFFGKKLDGLGLRSIQDYRKLNKSTIKNQYPLPLIGELVDKLKGSRVFTKLDVQWGYNNVRIKEGDKWKVVFRTNQGLFEPTVMFFGLTNTPTTFQAMMNTLFHDLIQQGKVVIYLDDILIFTKDIAKHRIIIKEVLKILRQNKLYLKPAKWRKVKSST